MNIEKIDTIYTGELGKILNSNKNPLTNDNIIIIIPKFLIHYIL